MGFEDLFKVFGGHHGGRQGEHHGGGHHDDHHSYGRGHGGHNYGYPDQCGPNTPCQGAPSPVSEQRSCPKCAGPVQSGFKFCPACGSNMEPAACKGCGAKLPPEAAFCPSCGAKVPG